MLDVMIAKLAEAQADVETVRRALDAQRQALEATPEAAAVRETEGYLSRLKERVTDLDLLVRELAMACYQETGEKRPHAAVTVKVFDVLAYDAVRAKSYAIEHLPNALKLDVPCFERAAKVLGLDWVTMRKEARAQVVAAERIQAMIALEAERRGGAALPEAVPQGDPVL